MDGRPVGALNLYSTDSGAFDDTAVDAARSFADHAAVAAANAGVHADAVELARNLQRALASRAVIDQAKGILMGRHRITADAAFRLLADRSQQTNRKLRDLAAELVAETSDGA